MANSAEWQGLRSPRESSGRLADPGPTRRLVDGPLNVHRSSGITKGVASAGPVLFPPVPRRRGLVFHEQRASPSRVRRGLPSLCTGLLRRSRVARLALGTPAPGPPAGARASLDLPDLETGDAAFGDLCRALRR